MSSRSSSSSPQTLTSRRGWRTRLSQDLDVATENPAPITDIVHAVEHGLIQRGWAVTVVSVDPLSARLVATVPATGEDCEVDILKENLWAPPVETEYGLVLALPDVIGTKVRALADRGAVRDLIDVHAAAENHTTTDLERLGERHGRDEFRLQDLHDRLAGAEWYDDEEYAAYGLTEDETSRLRAWAQQWANDLNQRLGADEDDHEV
jgi:hypothetical protein